MQLYLDRIIGDHDAVATLEMRKAVTLKDAVKLHQACGGYLFCLQKLQSLAPEAAFPDMKSSLRAQFFSGYLDGDLIHFLENNVPATADIASVGAFRQIS